MEDISGVFVPKTWLDEAIARANEYLNLYQTMHDEAQGYQNLYQTMHDEAQEYQSERDDALARAEAAERRAAELETQLAALQAAGEQEKKYELGRLALLAGVVANDEVSAHEMSEQIAQAIITLRAQLAAGEWRPVSEAPADKATVEAIVRLHYRVPYPLRDDEPTWNVEDLTDDYCIAAEDIRGWRPTPPQE